MCNRCWTQWSKPPRGFVAGSAVDPEHWAALRQRTVVPGRETITGRVALEGKVVHVADIRAEPDYSPEAVAAGRRTGLGVPLLRDGEPIGIITLSRKRVEPCLSLIHI